MSDFIFDSEFATGGASERLAWASAVFAEPTGVTGPIDMDLVMAGNPTSLERERALYNDVRLREAAIASAILLPSGVLSERLAVLRADEARARRNAAATRMRLET